MIEIEFNFDVPVDYRREFHLKYLGARHRIVVDKEGVNLSHRGIDIPERRGAVLDWIQDSIQSVRNGLGHP